MEELCEEGYGRGCFTEIWEDWKSKGHFGEGEGRVHLCTRCCVEEEWERLELIHNCVPVNEAVEDFSFSMDGIKEVARFLSRGDWMSSFDLKDGYTHVRIREDFRKFFGVKLEGGDVALCEIGFWFQAQPSYIPDFDGMLW